MKLQPTADGSFTLLDHRGVAYHSRAGALGESTYVYIGHSRLAELLQQGGQVHILEVGLGTGLNFVLSAQLAQQHPAASLYYTAYETHPPAPELLAEYYDTMGMPVEWVKAVQGGNSGSVDNVNWQFHLLPWPQRLEEQFDIIYYDAFGPKDAPELWTPEVLDHTLALLKPGGRLVTFSISGALRRYLRSKTGYSYITPKGYAYKREMLVVERMLA